MLVKLFCFNFFYGNPGIIVIMLPLRQSNIRVLPIIVASGVKSHAGHSALTGRLTMRLKGMIAVSGWKQEGMLDCLAEDVTPMRRVPKLPSKILMTYAWTAICIT